jgi:hypothetical protein
MRCVLLVLPCLIVSRLLGQPVPTNAPVDAAPPQQIAATYRPATISPQTLDKLTDLYSTTSADIDRRCARLFQRLQRKEASLYQKLQPKDSTRAKQLLADNASAYQQFISKTNAKGASAPASISNYVPSIDSMQTAIRFLSSTGLPAGQLAQLTAAGEQLARLQGSLANANLLESFIQQRQTFLNNQLHGLGKELTAFQSQANAYRQQIVQYKEIFNDPSKQQKVLMEVVSKVPAFQRWWQQNSILSQLFPMPGNSGTLLAATGLQNASQVSNLIQQRLGVAVDDGGAGAASYLQQQAAGAQGQIDELKDRLDHLNLRGGSSDMPMPAKAPDNLRHKTFLKRLEWGFNIQNSTATSTVPNISAPGLSVGYKLSNKATVGIGASYLVGLGEGLNHIRLSNQGIGLRSFIDVRAKGNWWLTGGYEYNYMQQFASLRSIPNIDVWQKSALFGVTKKYNLGKKTGNIQLLYDALANKETPHGQPVKLRFGYSL